MLRLAADENFNARIVRGLVRRAPDLDVVWVQDVGLAGVDDRIVLQWAADQGRVLLTHDVTTMTRWAYERMAAGQPMPGLIEVSSRAPIGEVIEELLLLALGGVPSDVDQQIVYLPL
jgi:hypothetical protein